MFAQRPQAALIILLDFSQPSCCTRWMSEKDPDLEAAFFKERRKPAQNRISLRLGPG